MGLDFDRSPPKEPDRLPHGIFSKWKGNTIAEILALNRDSNAYKCDLVAVCGVRWGCNHPMGSFLASQCCCIALRLSAKVPKQLVGRQSSIPSAGHRGIDMTVYGRYV